MSSRLNSWQLVHRTAHRARWVYREARRNDARCITQHGLPPTLQHPAITVRLNPRARSVIVTFATEQDFVALAAWLGNRDGHPEGAAPSSGHSSTHLSTKTALSQVVTQTCVVSHTANPVAVNQKKTIVPQKLGHLRPWLYALPVLGLATLLPRPTALLATLWAAGDLLWAGVTTLFKRGLNAETLEAAAVAISMYRRDLVAANTTNALVKLSGHIEHRIARKSDQLITSLLKPDVDKVWVIRDQHEAEVTCHAVQLTDRVVVYAGNTIPVDGVVLHGHASVNEVSMTGEAAPIFKQRGDRVLSGTVVSEGRLVIHAEAVGEDTAAWRINRYIHRALEQKSLTQQRSAQLADRLVPAVLGASALAYVPEQRLDRVASVLQADYSCALKLATPVAFKAGLFRAGLQGILFKGSEALEKLAAVNTVVFDKTGTLTTGAFEVLAIHSVHPAWRSDDILDLAASIEEHYFHPVAQAVVQAAREPIQGLLRPKHHFDHTDVQFIVGHGVKAEVAGQPVLIGSRHFLEDDEGIDCQAAMDWQMDAQKNGHQLLFIGYDRQLLGVIVLKDQVRSESPQVIRQLRDLGVEHFVMLTGDQRHRAEEVAHLLGLNAVYPQLLPTQKADIVKALVAQGKSVAFVGDGINDAPSLSAAHVGISLQQGAALAKASADVILLNDSLLGVAHAKAIAHTTMTKIDFNFKLTFWLNSAILLGAGMGLCGPMTTSVLHNGATVGILLNALHHPRRAESVIRH